MCECVRVCVRVSRPGLCASVATWALLVVMTVVAAMCALLVVVVLLQLLTVCAHMSGGGRKRRRPGRGGAMKGAECEGHWRLRCTDCTPRLNRLNWA